MNLLVAVVVCNVGYRLYAPDDKRSHISSFNGQLRNPKVTQSLSFSPPTTQFVIYLARTLLRALETNKTN